MVEGEGDDATDEAAMLAEEGTVDTRTIVAEPEEATDEALETLEAGTEEEAAEVVVRTAAELEPLAAEEAAAEVAETTALSGSVTVDVPVMETQTRLPSSRLSQVVWRPPFQAKRFASVILYWAATDAQLSVGETG